MQEMQWGYGGVRVEEGAIEVEDNEAWGQHFERWRVDRSRGLGMVDRMEFGKGGTGEEGGHADVHLPAVDNQEFGMKSNALVVKISCLPYLLGHFRLRKFTALRW